MMAFRRTATAPAASVDASVSTSAVVAPTAELRAACDLPNGCVATLPASGICPGAASPELCRRLAELGLRPGATLTMGPKVAGGSRLVTVGSCRYAIDRETLRAIEVLV